MKQQGSFTDMAFESHEELTAGNHVISRHSELVNTGDSTIIRSAYAIQPPLQDLSQKALDRCMETDTYRRHMDKAKVVGSTDDATFVTHSTSSLHQNGGRSGELEPMKELGESWALRMTGNFSSNLTVLVRALSEGDLDTLARYFAD